MNYTTYLFDFDYTLVDSSRGIVTCFRNVLTRHGYGNVTDDEIKRTIGKTLEDSFSILTGITDSQQLADLRKEYTREADVHMTVNTVLFLETKSVLIALKDAGAHIGIISTKYRYRIEELIKQHFPADFIEIIVGGEDVTAPKPSPEGILYAIKALHAKKSETLYIGDSTIDAETAQAAGVDFAGVTHGVTTAKELGKYPHLKIMHSLEELLEEETETDTSDEDEMTDDNLTDWGQKKRINLWQLILLSMLLFLVFEEMTTDPDTGFFLAGLFLLVLWGILRKRRIVPVKMANSLYRRWLPYKMRLRALHIKLIKGSSIPPLNNDTYTCLNCGNVYIGNYCNRCGQERNVTRYRFSNVLKNIAGGFTNIDNGFARTLLELLYRPGYLISDFIRGKRTHYFRPFQTLFVLAALYIMTVQLVAPEALSEKNHPILVFQEMPTTLTDKVRPPQEETFISILVDNSIKTSERIEQTVSEWPFLQRVGNLLKRWAHGNKAFRIIATLPLFALATQAAFYRKRRKSKYNPTEQLFVQAYIACQILLLSILVLPFVGAARVNDLYELPEWLIFFLFCLDYKQLYHLTWWKSLWSTLLMFCYCLLLIVAFAILVVALIALAGVFL